MMVQLTQNITQVTSRGHISVQEVTIAYGHGRKRFSAVDQISLDIYPGEFLCLIGPSGCGKSTLLNAIAGFISPTQGSIHVDQQLVSQPDRERGMVFQRPTLFPWKTVKGNVAHGPLMSGQKRSEAEALAFHFLEMVGLAPFADHYPGTLSGGMQQRVAIARALANRPGVLLMDEPFGALDAQTRVMMQENLLALWETHKTTVVFVTHDIDEAIFLGDRIAIMSANPGKILKELYISLPRPRSLDVFADPVFLSLKKQCFELIRRETLLTFERQTQSLSSIKPKRGHTV